MSSDTTSNLLKTIIARMLAYTNDGGQSITTYLGTGASARVYVTQAPDPVDYPYVIVRKINSQTDPEFLNLREVYDVEINCFGRPRSKEQETELIADLCEEALLTWKESSSSLGLSYGQRAERDTEPPDLDAVDRDIVNVRLLVTCVTWPIRLANALT